MFLSVNEINYFLPQKSFCGFGANTFCFGVTKLEMLNLPDSGVHIFHTSIFLKIGT